MIFTRHTRNARPRGLRLQHTFNLPLLTSTTKKATVCIRWILYEASFKSRLGVFQCNGIHNTRDHFLAYLDDPQLTTISRVEDAGYCHVESSVRTYTVYLLTRDDGEAIYLGRRYG